MSALYGRLSGGIGAEKTMRASMYIVSSVETWERKIKVVLNKEGEFAVEVYTKDGSLIRTVLTGNINKVKPKRNG